MRGLQRCPFYITCAVIVIASGCMSSPESSDTPTGASTSVRSTGGATTQSGGTGATSDSAGSIIDAEENDELGGAQQNEPTAGTPDGRAAPSAGATASRENESTMAGQPALAGEQPTTAGRPLGGHTTSSDEPEPGGQTLPTGGTELIG